MIEDCFGGQHRSPIQAAVAAFEAAVRGVAAHKASTGAALADALAADPNLVAAHALKGLANVILARTECLPVARKAYADALAARLAKGGATISERALTEALGLAIEGRLRAAADRLDVLATDNPHAFLPAKLAHALRFMVGDAEGMLIGTARVLDTWSPERPGFGFLLGCHAFALEEKGDLDGAERIGRRAVDLEPEDAWGLHAVSHVHEMQGRTNEGIAWVEGHRPVWTACNNFSFHMAWHLALFHLERSDHPAVLALYDRDVRPVSTDDFRDMANAASLLWRLRQENVDVGERWDELRTIALRRKADTSLSFASLHNILVLVATDDLASARSIVSAMSAMSVESYARLRRPDQAVVWDDVACELGAAIIATADRRMPALDGQRLGDLARRLQQVGGSHAQRDVFIRTLASMAAERGDSVALGSVLNARRRYKRDDAFVSRILSRSPMREVSSALSA